MAFTFTCFHCGIEFQRHYKSIKRECSSDRRFCSHKCFTKDRRKVHPRPCRECGNLFTPTAEGRPFCSRECYERSRANPPATIICRGCSRSFKVKACLSHRYNYCSTECRKKSNGGTYRHCERCSKVFFYGGSDRARGNLRRHCSEECRRPVISIQCLNCHKTVRIRPAEPRRYCSRACYLKFTGESSIESIVRRCLERSNVEFATQVQVGKYVIDFLIGKIVLEADGDYWHSRTKARDNRRDAYFQSLGYDVVRISEKEIKTSPDLDMLILARLSSINTANNYAIPGI